jgi:hypothetical protein
MTGEQGDEIILALANLHTDYVALTGWLGVISVVLCSILFFTIVTALVRWRN